MHSKDPAVTRALLGSRFKIMMADAGLSLEDAAQFLHVTPRTIRYWISGKTFVPYSAYKLLRIHCRFELPGTAWAGWHMHSGKLWTPEGHGFIPSDSTWWGLLVRKARLFDQLYDRHSALQHALNPKADRTAGSPEGGPGTGGTLGGRLTAPPGVAGGAAQPPALIYLKNTTRHKPKPDCAVIGETNNTRVKQSSDNIPYYEKSGVSS